MKQFSKIVLVLALASSVGACSSFRAASAPSKKDLSVLQIGGNRSAVLAEFGQPVASTNTATGKEDIFKFIQGNSAGGNAARSIFYGVAAVFTLGLSEVLTTPIEGAVNDQGEMKIKTLSDSNDKITDARVLVKGEWITFEQYTDKAKTQTTTNP